MHEKFYIIHKMYIPKGVVLQMGCFLSFFSTRGMPSPRIPPQFEPCLYPTLYKKLGDNIVFFVDFKGLFLSFDCLKTFRTFWKWYRCLFVKVAVAGDKNSLLSLFSNEEHDHLSTDSGLLPQARPLSGDSADLLWRGLCNRACRSTVL